MSYTFLRLVRGSPLATNSYEVPLTSLRKDESIVDPQERYIAYDQRKTEGKEEQDVEILQMKVRPRQPHQ